MKKFQKVAVFAVTAAFAASTAALAFAANDASPSPSASASPTASASASASPSASASAAPSASASAKPSASPSASADPATPAEKLADFTLESGKIKTITKDGDNIFIELENEEKDAEFDVKVRLGLNATTPVVDNKTGVAADLNDIKEGDEIYAYCSAIRGLSMPPYAPVQLIVTNVEKDTAAAYPVMVGKAEKQEKDDVVVVTSYDESYIITVTKDTKIVPYLTKNVPSAEDIVANKAILVWGDVITTSEPAKAVAEQVMILPIERETASPSPSADPSATPAPVAVTKVQANGKDVDLKGMKPYVKNDLTMIPLRAVSEALGFTVTWDNETQTASIDNGEVKTSFQIGSDNYYKASSQAIGLTQAKPLGAAPELVNDGTTFIPADAFKIVFSNDDAVTVKDGVLNIAPVQGE